MSAIRVGSKLQTAYVHVRREAALEVDTSFRSMVLTPQPDPAGLDTSQHRAHRDDDNVDQFVQLVARLPSQIE